MIVMFRMQKVMLILLKVVTETQFTLIALRIERLKSSKRRKIQMIIQEKLNSPQLRTHHFFPTAKKQNFTTAKLNYLSINEVASPSKSREAACFENCNISKLLKSRVRLNNAITLSWGW